MAVGVGASEVVGVAVETVPGTYVAPTHWMLLRSEDFHYVEDVVQRRPLRNIADVAGVVHGNARIEGSMTIEVTEDLLPQILRSARNTIVKTGAGPFTYTITPSQVAVPAKTMSVSVSRNGVVFGYTGVIIIKSEYSMDNNLLIAKSDVLGIDEASQTALTPTYVTTQPYGAGQYTLEIPTTTPVTDSDAWTFSIDDAGEAQYRIKSSRSMQFAKFGERSVTLKLSRDFQDRTEYDAFKALTLKAIKLTASKGVGQSVSFELKAAAITEYPISGGGGQGDLVRADISYTGVYDDTSTKAYEIICTTAAVITVP